MQLVYENATKHEKGKRVLLTFANPVDYRCGNASGFNVTQVQLVVKRGGKLYATGPVAKVQSEVHDPKAKK